MPAYRAPLRDMRFLFDEVLDAYTHLQALQSQGEFGADLGGAILEEAARVAEWWLAPLNSSGDKEGCHYDPATRSVKTPAGFREGYRQFAEGGWTALACPSEFGGQGLSRLIITTVFRYLKVVSFVGLSSMIVKGHGSLRVCHGYLLKS